MKHDQTVAIQSCKIGSGGESKLAAITKNSKNNKLGLFSRTNKYNWFKLCIEHQWNLGIQNYKNIKNPQLNLATKTYLKYFALKPMSQVSMNVFVTFHQNGP